MKLAVRLHLVSRRPRPAAPRWIVRAAVAFPVVVVPLVLAACAVIAGITEPVPRSSDAGNSDATADDVDADTLDAAPPRSCADMRASGVSSDGTYTIDPDGTGPNPPFAIYCRNMKTVEPTEYLDLPANADAGLPASNVSGRIWNAPAGDCTDWPTETVAFSRVRLDIQTMHIDPEDVTFAYVEGDGGDAGLLPFGWAGSCVAAGDQSGRGNVDLTGTPFRMTMQTQFVPQGWEAAGSSTFSPDRKRVDLTGGGFSGFNAVPLDAGGIGLEFDPRRD